jgi:hypothetical protein
VFSGFASSNGRPFSIAWNTASIWSARFVVATPIRPRISSTVESGADSALAVRT